MRLSDWGAAAPTRAAAGSKVLASRKRRSSRSGDPGIRLLGQLGEDPESRWVILAPTPAA